MVGGGRECGRDVLHSSGSRGVLEVTARGHAAAAERTRGTRVEGSITGTREDHCPLWEARWLDGSDVLHADRAVDCCPGEDRWRRNGARHSDLHNVNWQIGEYVCVWRWLRGGDVI